MTTTAPATPKAIPAQADVRIVGGKTTVKLRAPGYTTMERMKALCDELRTNAATHEVISKSATTIREEILHIEVALMRFVKLPPSEAGDEEAE